MFGQSVIRRYSDFKNISSQVKHSKALLVLLVPCGCCLLELNYEDIMALGLNLNISMHYLMAINQCVDT